MQCIIVLLFNLYQYYVGQAFRAAPRKGWSDNPYIVWMELPMISSYKQNARRQSEGGTLMTSI